MKIVVKGFLCRLEAYREQTVGRGIVKRKYSTKTEMSNMTLDGDTTDLFRMNYFDRS